MQYKDDFERLQSNVPATSRRGFLLTTAGVALGSTMASHGFARAIAQNEGIAIVAPPADSILMAAPPKWALGELKSSLENRGLKVRILPSIADAQREEFCVVASGMNSPVLHEIMDRLNMAAPKEAESLCLTHGTLEGRSVLLAAGTDERGLVYALTELADRVACLESSRDALEFPEAIIERPASRIRSIMRQFCSEAEDKVWFYDEDNWRSYLDMLAYSRVNRMSFTVGMGYNSARGVSDGYLLFPYPFFVDVSGYQVRAEGLADEERCRNLEMLKFIGRETARRGLRFQLGIWTLAYDWKDSAEATYKILGLTDASHGAYCRDALSLILREVPTVGGVTFRVHSESGIAKGSHGFWETQFSAIARCGRQVEIDMHAKNMEPETLEAALATGQPVVISPKYCGEHLSLPYHQSAIREKEMVPPGSLADRGTGVLVGNRGFTRYGYADTLAENRNWDVVFRIWPGTQRFLLNGDPATFAGYGRSASFCGAAGIDLCGPLDFKGRCGSGLPGGRCAYADQSLEPRYDFEKYRYTYRLWGRLGYNPDTDTEVWRRALRQEFGAAAIAVERALAAATRVLPLVTLAHAPAANCMVYWPEIYTNIPIAKTDVARPFPELPEPKVFGNVSPFDPQLFQSGFESGDVLLEGRTTGKYSPVEVAQWLENLSVSAASALDEARRLLGAAASQPGFRRIEEDVLIQRGIAMFFAGKLRSSVLWRIYERSGYRPAAEASIACLAAARDAWVAMAERAKTVYRSNITYGHRWTEGHWMDRIPLIEEDLADLKDRLANAATPKNNINSTAAERALKFAIGTPKRPVVTAHHTPAACFHSGQQLAIALQFETLEPRSVALHYRHVNQAERWQLAEMSRDGNAFRGAIPADYTARRYALQYYFEVELGPAEATFVPALASNLANVPYFIVRRAH
ncbi:MAG: hypothetical protein ACOY3P_26855 [Planctomycetota bacterium]